MSLFNLINAILVVTFVMTLITLSLSTDYCSKKICPNKKHIRCKNNGSFGTKCPKNAVEVPITDELRCLIVDTHNEARKSISAGNYKGLKNAKQMTEMEWNEELAESARYTAKTCVYAHDECRNTELYKNVGQNIAMYTSKAIAAVDYKKVIKGILESWLRQAKNCNMKLIESYRTDSGGKIDEFAQIIRARCSQVGCAVVYFLVNGTKHVFIVCNYSSANEPKQPIYEPGPACSACMTGCSFTSPGLCNSKEELYLLKLNLKVLGLVKLKLRL